MAIWKSTRCIIAAICFTLMFCARHTKALPLPAGGGRHAPKLDGTVDVNGDILNQSGQHAEMKRPPLFKWLKPFEKVSKLISKSVKTVIHGVDNTIDDIAESLLYLKSVAAASKRKRDDRKYEYEVAHGMVDLYTIHDDDCGHIMPYNYMHQISPDHAFGRCDILVSQDGKSEARMSAYGDMIVCTKTGTGDNSNNCYIAINGSGWSNYGLTLRERFQRNIKYLITRKQPVRTLPVEENYAMYRNTMKGSWSVFAEDEILAYGGNNIIKQALFLPRFHVTVLENEELILKRVYDKRVISRASRTRTL